MNLTEDEILQLEQIKHPLVQKLLDEYLSFFDDPAKLFYGELTATVKAICKDLEVFRNGEAGMKNMFKAEDRGFERLMALTKEADKIFMGIEKGKSSIAPAKEGSKRPIRAKDAQNIPT